MNDHDNLKQKLFEALNDLFSEKGYAQQYLLQIRDVPSEFKTLEEIKDALPASPSGNDANYEPVRFRRLMRSSWRDVF